MQNNRKQSIASNKKKQSNTKNTKPGIAPRKRVNLAPVSVGNTIHRGKPSFRNDGDNVIIAHSEFVTDIVGSSATFEVANTLNINPGLLSSFPWLSALAGRYESYHFKRLAFRYETESATSQTGYVALVPDYNPSDPAPTSKSNAFQHMSAVKCSPWENCHLSCTPSDLHKRKTYYCRYDSLSSNQNIDLFDTCNLFVCVGGNSGSVTLGELWIDYELVLETPQIEVISTHESALVEGGASVPSKPYGSNPTTVFGNNELFTYDGMSGQFTWLMPYQGVISMFLNGSGLGNQTPVFSSDVNYVDVLDMGDATGSWNVAIYTATFVRGSTMSFTSTGTNIYSSHMLVGDYKFSNGS